MTGARNLNDADWQQPPTDAVTFCEEGTVGWEDSDATNFYELGTAANDGYMLVRVQLFKGKSPHTAIKPGVGQGHRLLCRVGSVAGLQEIPPLGSVVVVLIPGGDIEAPGKPVIAMTVRKNPTTQIDPKRIVWDVGQRHLLLRGLSVAMQDNPTSGTSIGCSVGIPFTGGVRGFYVTNEQGSGFSAVGKTAGAWAADSGTAKSLLNLTSTEADLLCNDGGVAGFQVTAGDTWATGANFYAYTVQAWIGATAVVAKPCAVTAAGPANVVSATVFIGA